MPAGAGPASSHRRAAPSQREGAGRRGDGIRRGFRPSAIFFFLFGMGSAFQRGNWGNDWGPAVSTKPFFYMKGTPEAPSSAPTSFRVGPHAPALPGNRDRGSETALGRSTGSNVGIPQGGSLRWTLHIVYRHGEHGRGPKAPDVVPGGPTSSGITWESGSGERNGGGSVKEVQRRARKRALRWTLHIVYRRGDGGGPVFGADVVRRRASQSMPAGGGYWDLWGGFTWIAG